MQGSAATKLVPGTLLPLLRERGACARREGRLPSVAPRNEVLEQDGIAFHIRMIETVSGCDSGNRSPASCPSLLDPSLLVASISPSHLAFLSTEALCDDQLLIATRTNEDNRAQLTQKDCEALLIGLTEIDGLAWYDAGPAAGARALHKHFHLIPLTGNELSPLPLDPLLQNARTDQPIWSVPGLPFRHACAPMDPDWTNPEKDCGASVHACYRALMRTVGLPVQASTGSHAATGAYNLLATRKWLLLIPRAHDCVAGIPVQAPAFAGIFAVKTAAQLAALRRHSPLAVLQQAACPLREE